MTFEVTILGCGSATPQINRFPSAQILNYHERFFLIDCGEGTQIQMLRYNFKHQKIKHILISHLHGDHYLGLMGLISTMNLNGRTEELHLYGQPELMDIIEMQLKVSSTTLRYALVFHPLQHFQSQIIYDDGELEISTVILSHRIPCTGFLFREKKRLKNLDIKALKKYKIPISFYNDIKNGLPYVTDKGKTIENNILTIPQKTLRSYAYCSDTCYLPDMVPQLKQITLLYHEATFDSTLIERAKATFHSTAAQAASIAKQAQVKQLLLGHFSARYKNLDLLLQEAIPVFKQVQLAEEGKTYVIE
ncbi:MAG: ribonuclease Z [Bacteroidia bacterium]|nr:ribonuclease Z [Bacteroidia bacterium]